MWPKPMQPPVLKQYINIYGGRNKRLKRNI